MTSVVASVTSLIGWFFMCCSVADAATNLSKRGVAIQLVEYCQWETFNATCERGSVVMMTAAQYGRMRHGRCADTDVYIGCHADVLSLMDARCSGRESCSVAIPDGALHQQQPCPNDMMAYLEASFTCIPVVGAESVDVDNLGELCSGTPLDGVIGRSAVDDRSATPDIESYGDLTSGSDTTTPSGFLSSHLAALHGHGTSRCPWSITVGPGQRIELTLIDFSLSTRYRAVKTLHGHSGSSFGAGHGLMQIESVKLGKAVPVPGDRFHLDESPTYCHVYATVTETGRSTDPGRLDGDGSFTVCAGDEREINVYTSLTNRINIEISRHAAEDPTANFIIKYKAAGCADLAPPKNAWVTRTNDHVTVTCNHSAHTWHLVCKGNNWVGRTTTRDCESGSPSEERLTTTSPFPAYGLILAVLTGVVVGSLAGFSLLATILWCKRRSESLELQAERQGYDVELVAPPSESAGNYCKGGVVSLQSGDYSYTHVWQPLSATQPTGVNSRPSPSDLHCHHHLYKTASRLGHIETDAAVLPSVNTATNTGSGACRYVCKDHLYESPSFESGGAVDGTLQWSPYYWHGATPCLFVSRQQQQSSHAVAAAHPCALPTAKYDLFEHTPLNEPHFQPQQQQQQQHQQKQHYQHQYVSTGFRRDSSSIPLPSAGYNTATVNMAAGAVMLQSARDNDTVSSSHEIVVTGDIKGHTAPTGNGCFGTHTGYQTAGRSIPPSAGASISVENDPTVAVPTTLDYDLVTYHSSSSDPDVTLKSRSENHYT